MTVPESTMRARRLSDVASRYGLALRGPDREIVTLGALGSHSVHRDRLLTYVTQPRWLDEFAASDIAAAILPEALARNLPDDRSALVSTGDPETAFYSVLADTADAGEWEVLTGTVGEGTRIAPSAVVEDGVVIGRDCFVMAGAVLLANTRLGDRVIIKPNASLGGDGFQVREINGRRRVVPHTGGVFVDDDAGIGSATCVDRGLFGDFTAVGAETQVDNLVHIAHSVRIGRAAAVIACAEVSGSVTIGDGAWLGPRVATNPGLTLGDYCYIGTGSVVVRDVPSHALAYGNPAKQGGWMCVCHTKLPAVDDDGRTTCVRCGRAYRLTDDQLRRD